MPTPGTQTRATGTLVVPESRCGPPSSGNGGWTAGLLAGFLAPGTGSAVTVRLLAPPPLDTPMDVEVSTDEDGARAAVARRGDRDVARAGPGDVPDPVAPVDLATARAAEPGYRGRAGHPFPTCVVCGPDRTDGMRMSPGPLPGDPASAACTWVPGDEVTGGGPDVPVPAVWAALDCPGGWSLDLLGRPMVLGTITIAVTAMPAPGDVHVVTSRADGTEGRRARTRASLWTADGSLLAVASHVWVAVDPATFG